MVTKEIGNNYATLIENLNKDLKLSDDYKVTNLDDYFMVLGDISQQVQKGTLNPKFLILPNDEGWFHIDANTRKIDIPARFSSGASVQGDEAAEIIYFAVDRYFDVYDLYDKEIIVQWENAATPKPEKGITPVVNKTLQALPNKVVFGWPLTEEITRYPGKVKFSVRFFERKESVAGDSSEYLFFSLSTLTSEIKINSGLDFDIDVSENIQNMIVDKNDRIYNNIRNSSVANPAWPAKIPVFELDLNAEENMIKDSNTGAWSAKLIANVNYEDLDDAHHGVGVTKYVWRHQGADGFWNENLVDKPDYIPTTDVSHQNDTYYIKNSDGTYSVINILTGDRFPPINEETGEPHVLYEQVATYNATLPGLYQVKATNIYGRGNESSAMSSICSIPYAKSAIFDFEDANDRNYILNINADGEIAENGTIKVIVHTPDNGILTSHWVRSINDNPAEAIEFELKDGSIIGEQIGADQDMILAVPDDIDMYYFVKTINEKNNDFSTSYSNSIRVTKPAENISQLNYYINNNNVNNNIASNRIDTVFLNNIKLHVEINENIPHDEFIFEWEKKVVEGSEIIWKVQENLNEQKNVFNPASAGEYRCTVYTVYNKNVSKGFNSASFDLNAN